MHACIAQSKMCNADMVVVRFLLLTLIARAASVAVAPAPATPSDLARAHTKVPGAALRGSDYLDMTAKLNAHLAASDALATKACAEFSYAEVTDVLVPKGSFSFEFAVDGLRCGVGSARSKKEAKEQAAALALRALAREPPRDL